MNNPMGYTGVRLEAFEMGYNEFQGDPVPPDMLDMDGYTSGARYANIILPELRAMAGYQDSGKGTWFELTGEARDEVPYIYDELIDAFFEGMYQKNQDMIDAGMEMDIPPSYARRP